MLLYDTFLLLYRLGIRLASLADPKASQWLKGRKIFPQPPAKSPTLWMHCASLGEFEQGRPLLEAVKKEYPSYRIIITFFSPSGYEVRKNYSGADAVYYLPMDSRKNAIRFLDNIQPDLVLWVKYEYWFYYLTEIHKRKIPLLLVSAVFSGRQPFFKWYGSLWRKLMKSFTHVFVQNEESLAWLNKIPGASGSLSGDTRFDRVSDIVSHPKDVDHIKAFCGDKFVLVAGSTWEEDEEEWIHFVRANPQMAFIIAPHLVDEASIRETSKRFPGSNLYSLWAGGNRNDSHVLIIDNIGMLSRLYQYASVSYVGGGFGNSGLHNILEPAAYGIPVIFGPVYEKHFEAVELISAGGAFTISNALMLENLMNQLTDQTEKRIAAGRAAVDYVKKNRGATARILNYIRENRLLTSASN